jgi:hypothetical protein
MVPIPGPEFEGDMDQDSPDDVVNPRPDDPEAPETDAPEQPLGPSAPSSPRPSDDPEAPEADALDQATIVERDDDDWR